MLPSWSMYIRDIVRCDFRITVAREHVIVRLLDEDLYN